MSEQDDGQRVFSHREKITYQQETAEDAASHMVLLFKLPKEADLNDYLRGGKLDAWLLGKIHKRYGSTEEGVRFLCIEFKPVALLQD